MFLQALIQISCSLFLILTIVISTNGNENNDDWKGTWFPHAPGDINRTPVDTSSNEIESIELLKDSHNRILMGVPNNLCDNADINLYVDFDPRNNIEHKNLTECYEDIRFYKPDKNLQSLLTEYSIPPAYMAMHKCMNESIFYDEDIPTFGTHRPLWAKFGEYSYLPPQRWLHNLEHGSIVMLYHPCADIEQVNNLKSLVKSCLYRHIITPSNKLNNQYPLALVAWGVRIEIPNLNIKEAIEFIKGYALKGPEQLSKNGQYSHKQVAESQIVTTSEDTVLCPKLS